ncbi:peptide ABC transporter substrate-binding protein [Phenylobacterium sp. J367]|uniref:peptide ABC transporter substrate-binding protein n=1 Tax=Phenylobacterium sp. J367 TaxID=2898435 RepID=UPI00215070BF|nr:peptide ABC transporter substrate-binding protein [Phenylobacterium sp. J367]MCR5877908.1 peptide ABC transporter substrate-binding protein [Phenylobacterium sp. J367]
MKPPFLPLLAATALALTACQGGATRPSCPTGQTCLEYGIEIEPLTLDPQKANLVSESRVIGDLMMGLTTETPEAEPMPGMAESWTTSPDGLTWTFRLRDAKWSDGRPVTADDFVFGLQRILDPKTASIYAYLAYIIKGGKEANEGKAPLGSIGARAVDPKTLILTLEHPAPYLPQLLMHQSFYPAPKHVVERHGDAWVQAGKYVSNGPYMLTSWRLGDRIQAVKNPHFFEAEKICVDRINYYPTPDAVAAERRIERDELDINTSFQSNRYERLKRTLPGYARTHVALGTSYLSFNTRDVAALKDVRVRRALSESVDRDFITRKLLRAGQQPAYSFVPPITAGYAPGPKTVWAGKTFAERQAEARALLAQAGYTPQRPLKIEIKTANNTDSLLLMEAVQADWRAIGVDVSLQQNEGQIAFAAYRERDFQVGSMSWYADFNDPVSFLALMQSTTGAQNYGDYKNPAYDALLAQADQEPDLVRRAALLSRAEQLMLGEEGTAPLFYQVTRALVNPRVTGWADNALNFHRARWLCVKE